MKNLSVSRLFSTSCINNFPGPEKEDPFFGLKCGFTDSSKSIPDSVKEKQIYPQPPFENEQLDIAKKVREMFYKEKPTTVEEIDKLLEPIKEERAKAIEQYEKELEEDAVRYNKAAIKMARDEEIKTSVANHMVRESSAGLKREIAINRECCEKELNETLSVVAEIKERIHEGKELNYDNPFEDLIGEESGTRQESSTFDDYADTSTEMPDYTAGDD